MRIPRRLDRAGYALLNITPSVKNGGLTFKRFIAPDGGQTNCIATPIRY